MQTISKLFFSSAARYPGKQAIWCEGEAVTYEQLAARVGRWSGLMKKAGVGRGDAIGVLLPNTVEFVTLMMVAADLGAVLLPLNLSLPVEAVHRAFEASGVRHVVGHLHLLHALRSRQEAYRFDAVSNWFAVDGGEEGIMHVEAGTPAGEAEPSFAGEADDPFILTMTSGSTGDPKPIVLSQRTKINRAQAAMDLYSITPEDRVLAATPLYHSLAERLVLIPLLSGGTSVLMARFSPSEWLRCVRDQAVTFTIAVSSQLRPLAEHMTAENAPALSSLRCVVSSSALLDPAVKADLLRRLHCDFHECYGTSEIAIATNLDPAGARAKLHSVGKAIPGVDVKILDVQDREAPIGEAGEIVCRTPMIFAGYFRKPEQTRAAMWGDYFRTGDLGRLDSDGFLYYMGRKKDLVITGGINVYPCDVEEVIAKMPAVRECAVFPLPDDRLGEIVAVAIEPQRPGEFDLRAVRIHCARHLADFQQPRKLFVVESLPRNSMGKLMKQELVRRFSGHQEQGTP